MSGKLIVVVGGQYGSEGKGAVASYLARQEVEHNRPLISIRVAGSNAGHTVIDPSNKQRLQLRHVPVAVVYPGALAIAAGSEVDPGVLLAETQYLDTLGYDATNRLLVDRQATIVEPNHKVRENPLLTSTGTTGKGIGAARADRAMRKAQLVATYEEDLLEGFYEDDVATAAQYHLEQGGTVLIEGTQGYGLGLHAGYYPHCTSSDCRAIDFLAMAGLSPWEPSVSEFEVWIVYRSHPIRIAGPSGPLEGETTWEALGVPPEITTVTKKVRRVGTWDPTLAEAAFQANGGLSPCVRTVLTFADYLYPMIAGFDQWELLAPSITTNLGKLTSNSHISPFTLIGTGPATICDRRSVL